MLLFAIGLVAVLVRRNAIAVLMGVELMLNAANINFVAFWRYRRRAADGGAGVRGGRDHRSPRPKRRSPWPSS